MLIDSLGIDYIEGGYPGANHTDTALLREAAAAAARFCAFGMTKRAGRSAANDPGVAALLQADADAIVFVAKSWDYHVHVALGVTLEENLEGIAELRGRSDEGRAGRRCSTPNTSSMDYKANPGYALECIETAHRAGARWVVLCDTNGGTLAARDRGDRRSRMSSRPRPPCRDPCP